METERMAVLITGRLRRPVRGERRTRAERLAEALRVLVRTGAVPPGTRLPAERELSARLDLGRGTVAAAFAALEADGLAERRRGSGTYVCEPLMDRMLGNGAPPVAVDLAKSVVPDTALLPLPPLALPVADLLDADPADGYGRLGDPALRALLARDRLPAPYDADPARILVTGGAQQAIRLAVDAFADPGDTVLVEAPTYPGLLAALQHRGVRAVPLPGGADGPDPDALRAAARRERPAFAYLSGVANPTGHVLGAARARALGAAAEAENLLLVEDRTLAELVLDGGGDGGGGPAPSTAPHAPAHAAVLGSLSKTFWGGLRVGWIAAPDPWSDRLAVAKQRTDLANPALDQRLAARLLEHDAAAGGTRLAAWRGTLAARRDRLSALLREALPGWEFDRPAGGLSHWVRIGADGEEFAAAARRRGVAVAPGAVFGEPYADRIRIAHAVAEDVLAEAVRMLAAAQQDRR